MIFVISEDLSKIERVESKSFAALDVWERKHIQVWVRSHPEILGEDLLIVGMEFDRFESSKDRLDLLAVDGEGNLIVSYSFRQGCTGGSWSRVVGACVWPSQIYPRSGVSQSDENRVTVVQQ